MAEKTVPMEPEPTPGPQPYGIWKYLPSPRVMMCVVGIIASLMLYALLQERIMTTPYTTGNEADGEEGEKFKNSLVLVFANRFSAALVAAIILLVKGDFSEIRNKAPLYKYLMISVSNVIATSCQYEALKWVTLPTQTLAKCAKMIPVMIWGTIMSGKRYGPVEYSVAVFVALGCTIFLLSGDIKAKASSPEDSYFGLLLMLGYLAFDGFTSTFQEKLFAGYQMTIYNQMLYVNLCSGLMSICFLLASGKAAESIAFLLKYPAVIRDMGVLSFSAVSGQFAITYTIKEFGALLYATIMTIRQFLSVFVSNLIFRHQMTALQWFGAFTVFGALFYKTYAKATKPKSGPKTDAPAEDKVVLVQSPAK
ncbi:Adenosine 3'-phospho 5'-phosphosulfate transporter 1 [Gracilariopsis chorda]|uniref:Adenosine 3'-phospho 5'-phosphosulfate transporter 1 n=1 Tax=Gracilariopsis chorda TaxID=448386 RepID=A0A2V3IH46_9FLOR|nr:Adenosine 3'-phospho 5'-phosphosulfate transporter 1 [Gracilariopsis chorda]|eukprot:PXF41426.1 Adenosine 3'-phospho 5'-phosphosulfate transporter 1 [Gracilariopsis chorda]